MDVSRDEYNSILQLLKSNNRGQAAALLIELTQASEADTEIILDNIIEQEGITLSIPTPTPPPPSLADSSPQPPVPSLNSPAPVSQLTKTTITSRDRFAPADHEEDEETEESLYTRILPAIGIPLFIVSIIAGILAVLSYFISKAFIKNTEMEPSKRWSIVGLTLALPYLIYFGFIHVYSAPFQADRTTKVELPSYIASGKYTHEAATKALPIAIGDKNFSYTDKDVDLKIIAIGFHESANSNTNIVYYDPVTLKKLDYPFMYNGNQIKFEDVLKEKESMLDVKKSIKRKFY